MVCDNGPEFAGETLDQWAHTRSVALQFIQPGEPIQNAFAESFNGQLRDEWLNETWFVGLADALVHELYRAWELLESAAESGTDPWPDLVSPPPMHRRHVAWSG